MKWNMNLRQVNSVRQWINSEKESEGENFSSCQRWLEQTMGAPTFIGQLLVIRWAELIKEITQNASAEDCLMRYQRHCFVTHFWSCFRSKRRCLLSRIWIQRKDLKHCFFFFFGMLENLNETLRLCRSRCLAFMNYVCFYFSRIWFCFRASSGFGAVFFVPLVCAFFLSLSLFFSSRSPFPLLLM